jgi:hypothetical protein
MHKDKFLCIFSQIKNNAYPASTLRIHNVAVLVDGVHLNEDALIKYAAQVRMAVKCDDFRV